MGTLLQMRTLMEAVKARVVRFGSPALLGAVSRAAASVGRGKGAATDRAAQDALRAAYQAVRGAVRQSASASAAARVLNCLCPPAKHGGASVWGC